jgi:uncharacterized protein
VIRAVIDTNVFVSALISPSGNEAAILLAIHQGLIKPVFSAEILEEYAEVLARPKFGFAPDEIKALIALLRSRGEEVSNPEPLDLALPDPGDEKFVACALSAQAELLVTGDKPHFPQKACKGVAVVNAAELLSRIALEI